MPGFDLDSTNAMSLAGLEKLNGLTSIKIALPLSLVSMFSGSQIRRDVTQLWIVVDRNTPFEVPTGCKFVDIGDFVPTDFLKQ
jgi:hypothetical protein